MMRKSIGIVTPTLFSLFRYRGADQFRAKELRRSDHLRAAVISTDLGTLADHSSSLVTAAFALCNACCFHNIIPAQVGTIVAYNGTTC